MLAKMNDKKKKSVTKAKTEEFLNLENLIKSYLSKIRNLKLTLKEKKKIYDDSFASDAVYYEQAEKAKEAVRIKTATKQEILKQSELTELAGSIFDIRAEIKEAEEILSDYLLQYQKSTGLSEIEGEEGETMLIVTKARLVRGFPKA